MAQRKSQRQVLLACIHGAPCMAMKICRAQVACCSQTGPQTTCAIVFMTHFADLSSWELAQKLQKAIPQLQARYDLDIMQSTQHYAQACRAIQA